MTEMELLDLLRHAMWAGVWTSAPLLIVALVIGIAVGLLQALTGIQELTLTFVPKLIGIVIVFWLGASHLVGTLLALFDNRLIPLISG